MVATGGYDALCPKTYFSAACGIIEHKDGVGKFKAVGHLSITNYAKQRMVCVIVQSPQDATDIITAFVIVKDQEFEQYKDDRCVFTVVDHSNVIAGERAVIELVFADSKNFENFKLVFREESKFSPYLIEWSKVGGGESPYRYAPITDT